MRTLINQYFADKGKYPSDLQALVEDHYLQVIPNDPFTGNSDTWVTIEAEMTDEDITTEPGITSVKSGAEGTSLDGRSYIGFLRRQAMRTFIDRLVDRTVPGGPGGGHGVRGYAVGARARIPR